MLWVYECSGPFVPKRQVSLFPYNFHSFCCDGLRSLASHWCRCAICRWAPHTHLFSALWSFISFCKTFLYHLYSVLSSSTASSSKDIFSMRADGYINLWMHRREFWGHFNITYLVCSSSGRVVTGSYELTNYEFLVRLMPCMGSLLWVGIKSTQIVVGWPHNIEDSIKPMVISYQVAPMKSSL